MRLRDKLTTIMFACVLLALLSLSGCDSHSEKRMKVDLAVEKKGAEFVEGIGGKVSRGSQGEIDAVDFGSTQVTDADLRGLGTLTHLRNINLFQTTVTDAGLKELASLNLEKLANLGLGRTQVTDSGLKELSRFKRLITLNLFNSQITDVGLKNLVAAAEQLENLDLVGTRVTDIGLRELSKLKKLKHLDIRKTAVTYDGEADLQKALPRCTIVR